MKVKVLKPFIDLTAGEERKVGDEFVCSDTRFKEIKAKLPEWVEGVEEKQASTTKTSKTKTTSKKTTKKQGE